MEQDAVERAARAGARMAAVSAMHDAMRKQAELLLAEARMADAHGLALKAGAILRGSAGLNGLMAEGQELAAQAIVKAALGDLEMASGPRLMVSDLPPEMQA